MTINKDMTIIDILSEYPKTAEVFMRFGMYCIFCEAASGETLGEALAVHGYDEKDAEEMVDMLNETVNLSSVQKAESTEEA